MSLTLGIQSGHESSAVLFKDGKLVSAISEERLTRIKNDGGVLPHLSISRVLEAASAKRTDVNRLALQYTFFPEKYFKRETLYKELERKFSRMRRAWSGREAAQIHTGNLIERLAARGKSIEQHFRQNLFKRGENFVNAEISFYDHHEAHALPAAYYSGFDEAAIITMDGNGDWNVHHTSGIYQNGKITRCYTSNAHGASAGIFYSHITRLLGFKALRHEGKIVGLAAFGDHTVLYDKFTKALRVSADGKTIESDFMGMEDPEAQRYRFLEQAISGHTRENVAAAAQKLLEDVALNVISNFLSETGLKNVALNGGVFANVKLNQRIAELPQVDYVFVFPAMSDTGNSIGAVLLDMQANDPARMESHRGALESVYWGPEYSPAEIETALKAAGLTYQKLSDEALTKTAAQAIHDGQVIGWFQGRMEFGPRSLGNRSMIARPIESSINDWLNQRLDRSEFMPFAPSVLEEKADEVFHNVEKGRHTAAFMTITFNVKEAWRKRIAAVVHVDGTARPQLVSTKTNPLYHRLISEYYQLSGIPLVLNTSFNVHEEPIVCAPKEAIQAYLEKRVDCLAIGPFWLSHA